jgi:hypothetical protein
MNQRETIASKAPSANGGASPQEMKTLVVEWAVGTMLTKEETTNRFGIRALSEARHHSVHACNGSSV